MRKVDVSKLMVQSLKAFQAHCKTKCLQSLAAHLDCSASGAHFRSPKAVWSAPSGWLTPTPAATTPAEATVFLLFQFQVLLN